MSNPCKSDPLGQDERAADRAVRCTGCPAPNCKQRLSNEDPKWRGESAPKRADILDAVKRTICNDRQDVHGNPEDTHALIARMWSAYLHVRAVEQTPQDVAVMMCLFKIARHAMNPKHADNLHDLIGYAAIAAELGDAS